MTGSERISDERLKEIAEMDVIFDDDIPQFTEKQLKEFKPVNPEFFNMTPKKETMCIKIDVDILDALKR